MYVRSHSSICQDLGGSTSNGSFAMTNHLMTRRRENPRRLHEKRTVQDEHAIARRVSAAHMEQLNQPWVQSFQPWRHHELNFSFMESIYHGVSQSQQSRSNSSLSFAFMRHNLSTMKSSCTNNSTIAFVDLTCVYLSTVKSSRMTFYHRIAMCQTFLPWLRHRQTIHRWMLWYFVYTKSPWGDFWSVIFFGQYLTWSIFDCFILLLDSISVTLISGLYYGFCNIMTICLPH